jgi:hypothetical protein
MLLHSWKHWDLSFHTFQLLLCGKWLKPEVQQSSYAFYTGPLLAHWARFSTIEVYGRMVCKKENTEALNIAKQSPRACILRLLLAVLSL